MDIDERSRRKKIQLRIRFLELFPLLYNKYDQYCDLDCGIDTTDIPPPNRLIRKRVSASSYDQTVDSVDTIDKSLPSTSKKKVLGFVKNINPLRGCVTSDKFPNTVDENADGDQIHELHFNTPFYDSCFYYVNVFNPRSGKGDPPIGSARLQLRDLVLGGPSVMKTLELKDPSGNKIGELEVDVAVRRVENPHGPPEKIVAVDVEEEQRQQTVDELDENDLR